MRVKQWAQSDKNRTDTGERLVSEEGNSLFMNRGNNAYYYRRATVAHRYYASVHEATGPESNFSCRSNGFLFRAYADLQALAGCGRSVGFRP